MRLRYGCKKEKKNKPRKRNTTPGFNRFKGYAAAAGLGLMLITTGTNAFAQDKPKKDNIQNEQDEKQEKLNGQFMEAVEKGNIKKAKELLKKGADINASNLDYGEENPLIYASNNNKTKIIKFLVKNGADLNYKGQRGMDALMYAASNGNMELVKFLIEKGADVNAESSPWGIAFMLGYELGGDTPLMFASQNGHVKVAKFLIEKGADVNARDEYERTALLTAAWNGHSDVIKLLVENGADVNFVADYSDTALSVAAWHGHNESVKILVENGAYVNAKGMGGVSALLETVVFSGNAETVKLLIDNGAKVNDKDNNGVSALMSACRRGKIEIAKVLLENGADVNARDNKGKTALTYAKNSYSRIKDKPSYMKKEEWEQELKAYEKIIKMLEKAGAKE